uniref:Uncharacterized protein n=1 Tax=Anguilla anguilla TaxID=7936 RepID=A0A0E9WGF6_ANGAN
MNEIVKECVTGKDVTQPPVCHTDCWAAVCPARVPACSARVPGCPAPTLAPPNHLTLLSLSTKQQMNLADNDR